MPDGQTKMLLNGGGMVSGAAPLRNRSRTARDRELEALPSEKEIEEMAAKLQQGGGPKLPGPLSGLGGGPGGLPGFNPFKK